MPLVPAVVARDERRRGEPVQDHAERDGHGHGRQQRALFGDPPLHHQEAEDERSEAPRPEPPDERDGLQPGAETIWSAAEAEELTVGAVLWPGIDNRDDARRADWGIADRDTEHYPARYIRMKPENWADALYGVSMRQDGVSAVVGQRTVREREAATA